MEKTIIEASDFFHEATRRITNMMRRLRVSLCGFVEKSLWRNLCKLFGKICATAREFY